MGRGIFARKDIAPGTVIGDYLGKVIRGEDEYKYDKKETFYAMYYSDATMIFPDPQNSGIHLINHSCTPNCWMYTYKGHTLYFALRRIFKGEELTVSYLLNPQENDCKPCTHLCECYGVLCFQTMHLSEKRYALWDAYHTRQEKKTKPEKVQIGKELPALSSYPKNLSDNSIYSLFGSMRKNPQILTNQALPSVRKIRKFIRDSGRTIQFPALRLRVLGIHEDLVVSKHINQ